MESIEGTAEFIQAERDRQAAIFKAQDEALEAVRKACDEDRKRIPVIESDVYA